MISQAQIIILWLLNDHARRPSDLKGKVAGTSSNISQRIGALTRANLVTKKAGTIKNKDGSKDRRNFLVVITPKGKAILAKSKIELSEFELNANMELDAKLYKATKRVN